MNRRGFLTAAGLTGAGVVAGTAGIAVQDDSPGGDSVETIRVPGGTAAARLPVRVVGGVTVPHWQIFSHDVSDDAGTVVGDDREGYLFRVEVTDGETVDVRWRDLRPA